MTTRLSTAPAPTPFGEDSTGDSASGGGGRKRGGDWVFEEVMGCESHVVCGLGGCVLCWLKYVLVVGVWVGVVMWVVGVVSGSGLWVVGVVSGSGLWVVGVVGGRGCKW